MQIWNLLKQMVGYKMLISSRCGRKLEYNVEKDPAVYTR